MKGVGSYELLLYLCFRCAMEKKGIISGEILSILIRSSFP